MLKLFFALLMLCSSVVWADARESLDHFFNQSRSLRADIVQYRTSEQGKLLQESSGVLLIQRPGKVRLEYKKPYVQLYIADGKRLWSYDPELEQVIVKAMDEAMGDTPILLLSGTRNIEESFTVKNLQVEQSRQLQWLELIPKQAEAGFENIRLGFSDNSELRIMELQDALGNRTFIEFHNIQRDITHSFNAFRFTPPKGVDVIGEDALR